MLKLNVKPEPLYTLEALDLLEMIANHEEDSSKASHTDPEVESLIEEDLKAIRLKTQLKNSDLYRYFDHTKASLASCLINSFTDPSALKLDELKAELLKILKDFKNMRVDNLAIVERLNITKGEAKNLLDELLKLKIDDQDKILLIKALNDPSSYLDLIIEDIEMIKKELVKIYEKIDHSKFLRYFTKDKVEAILKSVNLGPDEKVDLFPSLVHHRSMSVIISDFETDPLKMRVGLSIDLKAIDNFSFFHDDLEERLKYFIKAINDPSKLKIIELLKDKEMYGAQLAKNLSLKTPTISYHVDALMNAGIIKAKRKDKRVYFEYDKKHTLAIIDYLRQKFS